jgi:hypothetical protein
MHIQQSSDGTCTRFVAHSSNVNKIFLMLDTVTQAVTGWTFPSIGVGLNGTGPVITHTNLYNTANFKGFNVNSFTAFGTCETTLGGALGVKQNFANDVDGTFPMIPIALASQSGGMRGRIGQLVDAWYGSTIINEGTTYPSDVTRQFVQFGHLILPWDGEVPLMT